MEPLPIPTLSASTPASIRFFAWAAVTTADDRRKQKNIPRIASSSNCKKHSNPSLQALHASRMPSQLFGHATAEIITKQMFFLSVMAAVLFPSKPVQEVQIENENTALGLHAIVCK